MYVQVNITETSQGCLSKTQRLCGDAELLGVLGDDSDGQEAEDEVVGLVADDLMIVQVPDGADCGGAVIHSAGESGDLRLQRGALFQRCYPQESIVGNLFVTEHRARS